MNMPGFTAEAALYKTQGSYIAVALNTVKGSQALLPQLISSRSLAPSQTSSLCMVRG